jgi:cytochrome c oxidase subunit II
MRRVWRYSVRTMAAALLSCGVLTGTADADGPRELQVIAKKYEFVPARLEVVQGETVRIVVRSEDGKHGFGIKLLDVKTEVPKTGEPTTIEFVAAESGEFEITCTQWCGKGHKTMKGLLVVRARGGSQ